MRVAQFEQLAKYFEKRGDIAVAYLFGSQAQGKGSPLSDLDIGILFNDRVSPEDYFQARLHLIRELSGLLQSNNIDVVVLNQAPVLLSYNIIAARKILFESDQTARIGFETGVIDRYLDAQRFRQIRREYLKEQIQRGDFIG